MALNQQTTLVYYSTEVGMVIIAWECTFLTYENISNVKRADFVIDTMEYIILKDR